MIWFPSTSFDPPVLCTFMRDSDRWETRFNAEKTGRLTSNWTPQADLDRQVDEGHAWTLWYKDNLVGMAGVNPLPENNAIGAIWFLGTDFADRHWHGMTRASRRFVEFQSPYWFAMGNIIPKKMDKRRAWLEKLGFDIDESEAHPNFKDHVAFWSRSQ